MTLDILRQFITLILKILLTYSYSKFLLQILKKSSIRRSTTNSGRGELKRDFVHTGRSFFIEQKQ